MAEASTSFNLWQIQAQLGLTFAPTRVVISGAYAVFDVDRLQGLLEE
jgi:hypothetical protein